MVRSNCAWLAAGVLVLGITATHARAEPAYTAHSILEHFSEPQDGGGAARAVCVGDCTTPVAKPRDTEVFDLAVTFELNSDTLTPDARRNLDEFARALQDPRLSSRRFSLDGHTDARGRESYNQDLSERRAAAVKSYLIQKGVSAGQLEAHGYGMNRPRTDDPLDGANRRVETRLIR